MRNRRFIFVTLTVVVLLVAGSGLAFADTEAPEPELDQAVENAGEGDLIQWRLNVPMLFWWFLSTDPVSSDPVSSDPAPEPVCGSDVENVADPAEEGCYAIDVTGPNGQVNHGSVVSAFVHALKALRADSLRSDSEFAYNGPKGQLVRDIAGSDLGKDALVVDDGDGIEVEAVDTEDDADQHGPPDHAHRERPWQEGQAEQEAPQVGRTECRQRASRGSIRASTRTSRG